MSEEVPPMSSTEFDMTVAPSAEQIRKREFATVRRGYDADQVRDYLLQVAGQIEQLEHRIHDNKADASASATAASDAKAALQAALDRARAAERDAQEAREAVAAAPVEPPADPYAAFGDKMAEMLRSAEADAEQIKTAAEMEARRGEIEARAEADRITTDAQARAEELRSEAQQVMDHSQEAADRMLAGLLSKKEALKGDLEHMRERLLHMADSLEALAGPSDSAPAAKDTTYFSEEQLSELWSGEKGESPVDEAGTSQSSDATFFSEEQLTELWAGEGDALLSESEGLTEQIDAAMADIDLPTLSPGATEPPVKSQRDIPADGSLPIPGADSPFFVDETTPADDDPASGGLYPR